MNFIPLALPGREHIVQWSDDGFPTGIEDLRKHYAELADIAEDGGLDAILFADTGFDNSPSYWERRLPNDFDPLTFASYIAGRTSEIGIIVTMSTTFEEPFNIARRILSLDHLSGGRAGWNIITTATPSLAQSFSDRPFPGKKERYERADEAVSVIKELWESYPRDGVPVDRAGRQFVDPRSLRPVDFHGRYFDVNAILGSRSSVQGRPLLVQAGSSPDGRTVGARHADLIFTFQNSVESLRSFGDDLRQRARSEGREQLPLIFPGVTWTIGDTEEDARRIADSRGNKVTLESLLDGPTGNIFEPSALAALRKGPVDPGQPLPPLAAGTQGPSWQQASKDMIRDNGIETLGDFLEFHRNIANQRPYPTWVGTAEQIAAHLKEWFVEGAADGFALMLLEDTNTQLRLFTERVLPLLEEDGFFSPSPDTGSHPTTLRERLGLPVTGLQASPRH